MRSALPAWDIRTVLRAEYACGTRAVELERVKCQLDNSCTVSLWIGCFYKVEGHVLRQFSNCQTSGAHACTHPPTQRPKIHPNTQQSAHRSTVVASPHCIVTPHFPSPSNRTAFNHPSIPRIFLPPPQPFSSPIIPSHSAMANHRDREPFLPPPSHQAYGSIEAGVISSAVYAPPDARCSLGRPSWNAASASADTSALLLSRNSFDGISACFPHCPCARAPGDSFQGSEDAVQRPIPATIMSAISSLMTLSTRKQEVMYWKGSINVRKQAPQISIYRLQRFTLYSLPWESAPV